MKTKTLKSIFQPNRFGVIGCNSEQEANSTYKTLAFLLAIVYASILSQLPDESFKDYSNYLIYAEHSWFRLLWLSNQGFWVVLANEPAWLLANALLGLFLQPDTTVRSIIFFSAFLVSFFTLLAAPKNFWWLLFFLVLASVVKNHLIHIRQGFAVAVFIWAWFSSSRFLKISLLALTPFVHASFFFILMLLIISNAMLKLRLGPGIRSIATGFIAAAVGLGLGWLAALFGARQAQEYEFSMAEVSGFGFLIWLSILIIYVLEGKTFLRRHAFALSLIIFYLGTYFFIEVTARIFESGLLLVLLAGLSLSSWRLLAYKFLVISVLFLANWLMRISEPALGFGIA